MEENIVICGVVKAEILHGAKNEKQLMVLSKVLSSFDNLPIEKDIWDKLGSFFCTA